MSQFQFSIPDHLLNANENGLHYAEQANQYISLQMQLATQRLYPGLARRIYLKGYRYNLHYMPKSLLIEAGAQNNTVEELKNAMELLANVLEEVLL